MPGTWEGPGSKCSGDHRPFHQVCLGVCNKNPNSTNDGKDCMGQIYCPLWSTQKDLTNQGGNFESQLVADLCELMGVWKIWTSPYHLQTNGHCERFNSTRINMLGTLPKEKKSEWKNHIGTLVHAYDCTQNSATGFSPYYLHVWQTTSPSSRCGTWFGSTYHHGAKHNKVHPEFERTH